MSTWWRSCGAWRPSAAARPTSRHRTPWASTCSWTTWIGKHGRFTDVMLPATIPIFPLPNAVLFPNVFMPLHIFEARYRAMVTDVLAGDRIIGMVLLKAGFEADYAGRPPIFPVGCAGVVTHSERLPDGRFNIVLKGIEKFRVTGEDGSRPYRLARIEGLPELVSEGERAELHRLRQRLEA